MRWVKWRTRDKRIVKRFALFPISTNSEVRWLEWCTIEQIRYDQDYYLFPWQNQRFIDDESQM